MSDTRQKFDKFLENPLEYMKSVVKPKEQEQKEEQLKEEPTMEQSKEDLILEKLGKIEDWQQSIDVIEDTVELEAAEETVEETKEAPEAVEEPKEDPAIAKYKEEIAKELEDIKALKAELQEAKPQAFTHNPEGSVEKSPDFLEKLNDPVFRKHTDATSRFYAHLQSVGIKGGVDPTKQ